MRLLKSAKLHTPVCAYGIVLIFVEYPSNVIKKICYLRRLQSEAFNTLLLLHSEAISIIFFNLGPVYTTAMGHRGMK